MCQLHYFLGPFLSFYQQLSSFSRIQLFPKSFLRLSLCCWFHHHITSWLSSYVIFFSSLTWHFWDLELYYGSSISQYLIYNITSSTIQSHLVLGFAFPSFTGHLWNFFPGIFNLIDASGLLVSHLQLCHHFHKEFLLSKSEFVLITPQNFAIFE